MCSILKKRGKIGSILANVITDYGEDPYNEWISGYEYIDYIFVAHNDIKIKLTQKGVPENKVFDTEQLIQIERFHLKSPKVIIHGIKFSDNENNLD